MVYIKKMKSHRLTYLYWAHNYRENGKIKTKLFRRVTWNEERDNITIDSNKKITIIKLPDDIKELVIPTRKDNPEDYHYSKDKINELETQINELQTFYLQAFPAQERLHQWIQDIESGKIKNTPSMRPKAFIKKVLRPMLNL